MSGHIDIIVARATWSNIARDLLAALAFALSSLTLAQAQAEAPPDLDSVARRYFPAEESGVAPRRIFRLTRDQIDATVQALLPSYMASSVKTVMPRDPLQTNFEYAELLAFNGSNAAALTSWIGEIATRVRKSHGAFVSCAAAEVSCLEAVARRFARKAFRADAPEDKIEQFAAFFLARAKSGGVAAAAGDLVEVTLNSPYFLFRRELDISRRGRLTAEQRLAALAYTLADAPPDALGLPSGEALGHLQTDEAARATITRVLASKEAREKLLRFVKAWLEVKDPGEFTISQALFPEFTATLAAAMTEETDRFLRAQLSREAPTLKDITQANVAYISKPLEAIYGAKSVAADGSRPARLDAARRLGIFSQPAVVASHSGPTNSRPVKRGVFWVRKVMCMEMEPPPKELHIDAYDLKGATEREKIESATQGSACAGCHKIINPFAFFQESYDALGRFRTDENAHPINSTMRADFLDEGAVATNSTVEALKVLTGSAKFKQCFARQMFRFYMGRSEETSDEPLLRDMFLTFARGDEQDLLKTLEVLATSDGLTRRR